MLKVYGRPNSSNSAKVFWLLDQIGQDYDLVPAGRGFGPTDTPEFLALNPFGKVPVVQDGDLAVWESNAVLRYLARRFDATALWPADAAGQSRIDRWMDWASISLTPPLTRLRKARAAGKGDDADLPAIVTGFALLDQQLARHDFIAGTGVSGWAVPAGGAVGVSWALRGEAASRQANARAVPAPRRDSDDWVMVILRVFGIDPTAFAGGRACPWAARACIGRGLGPRIEPRGKIVNYLDGLCPAL